MNVYALFLQQPNVDVLGQLVVLWQGSKHGLFLFFGFAIHRDLGIFCSTQLTRQKAVEKDIYFLENWTWQEHITPIHVPLRISYMVLSGWKGD